MRVALTSAYGEGSALRAFRECAKVDRFGIHEVVENADTADLILFVENAHYDTDPYYSRLRTHSLVRRFPEKSLMYNESDEPWLVVPGLYCSMPKWSFTHGRQRAFCYLYGFNPLVEDIGAAAREDERDLLFSFVGGANHSSRRRIFALRDSRSHVEDSSSFSIWNACSQEETAERHRRFAEIVTHSRFILCPRGAGTASYRLFEALQAGRAPVVISDQWVAPEGPDWESFALRVPEARVEGIPELLRKHEGEHFERGRLAREAWEQWFAPPVRFHRAIEACAAILGERRARETFARHLPRPELQLLRLRRSARVVKRATQRAGAALGRLLGSGEHRG